MAPVDELKSSKYPIMLRIIHWFMVLLILSQFLNIFYLKFFGGENAFTLLMVETHHATGITIFIMLLVRISVRIVGSVPKLPESLFSFAEQRSASLGVFQNYQRAFSLLLSKEVQSLGINACTS